MGQSTTSLSLSDPAGTIAVAPTAGPDAAAAAAVVFCATLRMHLAHSVWKQLSRHGSVYLCPQLWNTATIHFECSPRYKYGLSICMQFKNLKASE